MCSCSLMASCMPTDISGYQLGDFTSGCWDFTTRYGRKVMLVALEAGARISHQRYLLIHSFLLICLKWFPSRFLAVDCGGSTIDITQKNGGCNHADISSVVPVSAVSKLPCWQKMFSFTTHVCRSTAEVVQWISQLCSAIFILEGVPFTLFISRSLCRLSSRRVTYRYFRILTVFSIVIDFRYMLLPCPVARVAATETISYDSAC